MNPGLGLESMVLGWKFFTIWATARLPECPSHVTAVFSHSEWSKNEMLKMEVVVLNTLISRD
jgi:hypothetical protein